MAAANTAAQQYAIALASRIQRDIVPSQIIEVYGQSQEQAYSRIVPMREVTFTCCVCRKTVTQLRYPSRLPRYCSDTCKAEREEQRNEERVRKRASQLLLTRLQTGKWSA